MNYSRGKWKPQIIGDKMYIDSPTFTLCEMRSKSSLDEHRKEMLTNVNLIVTAVNSCISVNEDNPQAVAESIKEMYIVLNRVLKRCQNGFFGDDPLVTDTEELIKSVLTKAERKG